ncbi:extracellular solute-binding protein [Magnetovibrio sp. PR-2]|uniref:extracellular solute-binding protein n=1 Tax=Magnetovibrio sp. PR-2 TaxID=3120356 RepID=UPI002FCE3445
MSLKSVLLAVGTAVALSIPSLALSADVSPTHAIAMHGEPKYGPDFKHFDYVNPTAPKGGTLRRAGFGSFDNFNAFIPKGETADGVGMLYDSLLTSSADEAFTEYGLLAKSVEVPQDRSWITFHLRPEAKWHDGKSITAEDVKWTFDTLIAKGAPLYKFYYKDVEKVEILDPLSVKFTFSTNENRELPLIIGQMAVLPKHYWDTRDFTKTTLEPPLGSGAYKIGKFETGRSIEYDRVENYWGKDLPVNVGTNNFDHHRYDYFRDGNIQVEALKGGAVDFRLENISKTWATAYDIPAVEQGQLVKEEVHHNRPQGMQAFIFNTRRTKFQDARVRRALGYAFDFEWANKNLFYGQYTRTRSYFDNSELAATGLPSEDELKLLEPLRGQIPDAVFTEVYNPPATKGDGRIRTNLKEADRLLKEAGWVIQGKDRVNTKTGEKLEAEIILVQPTFERIVLPFAKNLKRLGITLNVRTIDPPQYIQRMRSFDFDIMVSSWGQSDSPGNEQLGYWGSAAADTAGSRNYIGIKSDAIDNLVAKIIAAPTREDLITRVRALDRVLQHGHYVIAHWHIAYDRLVYWNKFSRPDVTPQKGVQIGAWWYDEAKAATLKAQGK